MNGSLGPSSFANRCNKIETFRNRFSSFVWWWSRVKRLAPSKDTSWLFIDFYSFLFDCSFQLNCSWFSANVRSNPQTSRRSSADLRTKNCVCVRVDCERESHESIARRRELHWANKVQIGDYKNTDKTSAVGNSWCTQDNKTKQINNSLIRSKVLDFQVWKCVRKNKTTRIQARYYLDKTGLERVNRRIGF